MRTAIRVISLPHATERQALFRAHASGHPGLEWEFFDASQSRTDHCEYSEEQALVSQGRALTRGEVGCFVSHVRVWQHLLTSSYEQMLVVEDDVFVDWPAVFPLLQTHLGSGIDYLRLYAKRPALGRELGWLHGRRLLQYLHYCYGTQAYLLTRTGAQRFLRAATTLDRPIDDFMDRSWHHGIPNLALFPFPVMELSGRSSIGGEERYASKSLTKVERVRRISYQVADKLSRLAHTARELSPIAKVSNDKLPGVSRRA